MKDKHVKALRDKGQTKLTFADLDAGDKFITFPDDGDNAGHGGYLWGAYLFLKINDQKAVNISRHISENFSAGMEVIHVI